MLKLFKIQTGWKVVQGTITQNFATIERAADAMLDTGILDEDIDAAVIALYANEDLAQENFPLFALFDRDGRFVDLRY